MRGLLIVLSLAFFSGCASLPEPEAGVATGRMEISTGQGAAKAVRFAAADARGARGIVVFVHGFLRGPSRHAALASRLAREGHVVVLPDLDSPFADGARARDGAHVLALLREALKLPGSDGAPIIIGGFSRGAGIALDVAAKLDSAERARLAALLLLDPVTGPVPQALRAAAPSVALVAAPPAPCNAQGRSFVPLRNALRPTLDLQIEGATHCDPESPSDLLCAVSCGAPDPARQARFTDALVSFVLEHTRNFRAKAEAR